MTGSKSLICKATAQWPHLELLELSSSDHPAHTGLQIDDGFLIIPVSFPCFVPLPTPLDDFSFGHVQKAHTKSSGEHSTSEALDLNDGFPKRDEPSSADMSTVIPLDCDCGLCFTQILGKSGNKTDISLSLVPAAITYVYVTQQTSTALAIIFVKKSIIIKTQATLRKMCKVIPASSCTQWLRPPHEFGYFWNRIFVTRFRLPFTRNQ